MLTETGRILSTLTSGLLLLALSSSLSPVLGQGASRRVVVKNVARVYAPRVREGTRSFKKPAVVNTAVIFAAIPEWRAIERREFTPLDAEYHLLLSRANARFHRALTSVRLRRDYDLVAEEGAIECLDGSPPEDATGHVLRALR